MITALKILNFKSIEALDLKLAGTNLLVGTNASGKSNLLDALRLLQGIGFGFTISEVLNGKPQTATSEVWEGVRGGAEYARFKSASDDPSNERLIRLELRGVSSAPAHSFSYAIEFSAERLKIASEWLSVGSRVLFDSRSYGSPWTEPVLSVEYSRQGLRGRKPKLRFDRSVSVLHQLVEHAECTTADRRILRSCISVLSDMQRLDPSPEVLRRYSAAQEVPRMGEHGENFAALINVILQDPQTKQAYLDWLRELSPADVDDVVIMTGALREPLFAVVEDGNKFPAPVLSDGTLRFAALAAAFFQKSMPSLLTIEEIEKGIHPNRLRLLVELLRSQTDRVGNQVIATTHSPEILNWLTAEDLRSTFIATKEENGSTTIKPLSEIANLGEAVHANSSLSELFSEGWLEHVA